MAVESHDDLKTRLLVVDDDKKLCRLIKDYLEPLGYDVVTVHTGKQGLEKALAETFDAVILDIMMPEMDGLEVLTRLKGMADTTSIPIILLTAKVQYEDVLGGYKLGADYYITKPFTSTQLVNGINLLLGEAKH